MKAIRVDAFGGPEVLKLQEVAVPKVTPGTLLVRLKAVGVNPIETYIRAGAQNVELPYIPGTDGAGVVEEVGDGVTSFKKGDKVFVCGTEKGSGTYAEYCLSSKDHVRPLSRSFEAGAAVGIPYRTAYRALNQVTSVSKDESLLIHGSSGAVGIACLQLAKDLGIENIAGTAGSSEGLQLIKSEGATVALNHRDDNYTEGLKDKFPDGVDNIIEMLANVNLNTDLELLRRRGTVTVVGSRGPVEINPRLIMAKELSVNGFIIFNIGAEENRRCMDFLAEALDDGAIKPIVEKSFSLEDAPAAHDFVINKKATLGKIVLKP
eukprot:CAMPEP_0198730188 /NCGR_PEP_ID=MMETSP1475-20131203/23270_1 /TAXON_ID= ORGANISM="Unidentified sp., Strain CCMP1999" /NCGR_SAMPLE_ID=MMETSP1475 /ASSEMBLY_ACC=CAM_ASM_001111 /LENGTH=319 /DNA_ID=CAMNT_0044492959 /DNA_START=167 /DNA_END=1126 /DNA_ORIENTATION=+